MKLALVFLAVFFMLAPALAAPADPEKESKPKGEANACAEEPCITLDPQNQDEGRATGDEIEDEDSGKPEVELEDRK